MNGRWLTCVLAVAAPLAAIGCGSGDPGVPGGSGADSGASPSAPVIVSAAASLTEPLTACRGATGGVSPKLSFAGSDELAAQIRQGVTPDVYLAANTTLPDQLHGEGELRTPLPFATNELVLAVPAGSTITSIDDLAARGVTLVVGAGDVPFGAYTRTVLGRLPAARRAAILGNVRSEEPNVKSAVGKLLRGAADASFTYATDVRATRGQLTAIALPAALRPTVAYGGGIVTGAPHAEAARAYLESVTSGACARALRAAGFGAAD